MNSHLLNILFLLFFTRSTPQEKQNQLVQNENDEN